MNASMRWGGGHPLGHNGGEHQISIPLIPAPVALFAMVLGLMIGVMIGRKKSMMHGTDSGMGGDWDMRRKMMGNMASHHHHGDGMQACGCGCGHDAASAAERTTDE